MAAFLELRGVTKRFGDFVALNDVSIEIQRGEIFSLLGPSGCGKTTLLRVCAGFEHPDAGRVILDGHDITDLPPNRRRVNTIFQNYALFPHLTVWENIAFGLRVARRPESEIKREVDEAIETMQLAGQELKRPALLSGGQKQRVAVARALVNKPEILLLDEPLAALDLKLRQRMLVELDNLHDEVGITFLFVTHDQGEAMSISDRIAVMNNGRVEQLGTAAEIYEAPRTSFVAAFIGDTNFFDGQVAEGNDNPDYCQLQVEGFSNILCFNDKHLPAGQMAHLSIRPEKFRISRTAPPPAPLVNVIAGRVEEIIYQGTHTNYWVRAGDYRVAISQPHSRFKLDQDTITWKDNVWLAWHADDGCMLEQYRSSDENLLSLPDPDDATPTTPPTPGGVTVSERIGGEYQVPTPGTLGRTVARRRARNEWLVTLPSLGWLLLFFLVPTVIVLAIAFKAADPDGNFVAGWTLATLRSLNNPNYPAIVWRTVWVSLVATAICMFVAIPFAYYMARAPQHRKSLLVVLVMIPFWTSFLIRIFAWKVLLHPEGYIHKALRLVGLIQEGDLLLYNPGAVLLVLVYTYLPFAILPLYAAAEKFDFSLFEAALDLGCNRLAAFMKVFIPGIQTGLVTAALVVFIPALGSYVIPDIVGGNASEMIGNKIAQRTFVDRNLPHAAGLAGILTLSTVIPMILVLAWQRQQARAPVARQKRGAR